jgi:hypothetical protein
MKEMMRPDVKAISFGAFEQLSLDLLQCESKYARIKYGTSVFLLHYKSVHYSNSKRSQVEYKYMVLKTRQFYCVLLICVRFVLKNVMAIKSGFYFRKMFGF